MWHDDYLDEIRLIDREQAPHGFYGLRDKLSSDDRYLIKLGKMLGGNLPGTNVASRLDWKTLRPWEDIIRFILPTFIEVGMSVESYASTKVRDYGGAYRLDNVHGKKLGELPRLESKVPKLSKQKWQRMDSLLFIAHVATEGEFARLLGKTSTEVFLDRYKIRLTKRVWKDIYGRDFYSGLFLWSSKFDLEK